MGLAKTAEPFVCGGSAATFASVVIHPIDLAKVCVFFVERQNFWEGKSCSLPRMEIRHVTHQKWTEMPAMLGRKCRKAKFGCWSEVGPHSFLDAARDINKEQAMSLKWAIGGPLPEHIYIFAVSAFYVMVLVQKAFDVLDSTQYFY